MLRYARSTRLASDLPETLAMPELFHFNLCSSLLGHLCSSRRLLHFALPTRISGVEKPIFPLNSNIIVSQLPKPSSHKILSWDAPSA